MAVEKSYFYAQEEAPLCILSSPFVSASQMFLPVHLYFPSILCLFLSTSRSSQLSLPPLTTPPLATQRRGYVYWRLLSSDPEAARAVVLSEKPEVRVGRHLLEQCNAE